MTDKYDQAVAYLTEHPDEIYDAWMESHSRHGNGGELFMFCTPSGRSSFGGESYGCLTMIKCGFKESDIAFTDELTAAIRADDRLPMSPSGITPEHLPVFAEWQRRIDRELNRN